MDELRKKITDPGLRAIAEHGDDSRCVEVIIELDLPPTAAPPGHVRHGYGRRGGVASLAPDADEPFDPHDAEMDRLERDLRSLRTHEPPVRLKTAQAFAVTLNPAQLRAAVKLALTGAIRPSRTHRP